MNEFSSRVKNFPIRVLLGFLLATELLFFVAPQQWQVENYLGVELYLALMNVALWAGYARGVKSRRVLFPQDKVDFRVVKWLILIALPMMMVQLYWAFGTLNPASIFTSVQQGITDSGAAYSARKSDVNLTLYALNSLMSPVIFYAFALGSFAFRRLPKKYRFILLALIAMELSKWLSIGVRKGVMDMIITLLAGYVAGNYQLLENRRKLARAAVAMGSVVAIFIAYFLISNLSRYSQESFATAAANYSPTGVYAHLPSWLLFPIYSISGYLCQGYYALAKALEVGFIQPDLLATNFFTVNVAERFGINPLENSYMDILQSRFGIDTFSNWHSIYVWLANGFTFAGVPLFIYAVGYLFGQSWILSIRQNALRAVPMFVILAQMIFYFFANNQIFSFSFPTIIILMLLYFSKIRL